MKLYMFPGAPNPTRVRLYLAEKAAAGCEIPIEQIVVNLIEGEHRSPEHLARNTMAKLPLLELDDGSVFGESLAIVEYLEELHPEPPLIGADPLGRLAVRELERVAELNVLAPIARYIHATRSPTGRPANPEVAEYHKNMLPGGLAFLEEALSDGRPYLSGEGVSIADFTLAAAFQFARFRDVEIEARFERVLAWDARYREREAARATLVF